MVKTQKYLKEDILKKAVDLSLKIGLEKITIRKVANHANCSTQPIYRNYESFDELKEQVSDCICDKVIADHFDCVDGVSNFVEKLQAFSCRNWKLYHRTVHDPLIGKKFFERCFYPVYVAELPQQSCDEAERVEQAFDQYGQYLGQVILYRG